MISERLERITFAGMLTVSVLAALVHGAVEAWSRALVELLIAFLLLLAVLGVATAKRIVFDLPVIVLPVAGLVLLGVAQAITIGDGGGPVLSISADPEATRSTVLVLVFVVIFFWLAANSLATAARLRAFAGFASVYGLAMALFALVQHLTWEGRFYWFRPNSDSVAPFGPFVNHNHFAGYMNMLVFLPLALAFSRSVRPELRLFHGFAAVIMGISVAASLSRGGIVSLLAGAVFLAAGSALARRKGEPGRSSLKWSQAASVAVIAVTISAGLLWIAAGPLAERTIQTIDQATTADTRTALGGRIWIWRDTLSMIVKNPFFGVGLGAYETAYPTYTRGDGALRVSEAHNDYLQVVADGGVIGAALALWFLVLVSRAFARGLLSAGDRSLDAVVLGAAAGLFTMLVHSLFDFNLQLPSNALLFLVLSAVVYRVWRLREKGSQYRLQVD